MNRFVVLLIAVLMVPSLAAAQTPTSDDEDGVFTTIRKQAGIEANGEVTAAFEQAGLSLEDPLYFLFWVTSFENEDDAERMMDVVREEFVKVYLERFSIDFDGGITMVEASGVDVGDDQLTLAGERTAEGFTAYDGIVFVRVGALIVAASGAALFGNIVDTLSPFIESMVDKAAEVDGSDEGQLAAVLPALADLPPGYVVAEID